jgi:hypothetical protein
MASGPTDSKVYEKRLLDRLSPFIPLPSRSHNRQQRKLKPLPKSSLLERLSFNPSERNSLQLSHNTETLSYPNRELSPSLVPLSTTIPPSRKPKRKQQSICIARKSTPFTSTELLTALSPDPKRRKLSMIPSPTSSINSRKGSDITDLPPEKTPTTVTNILGRRKKSRSPSYHPDGSTLTIPSPTQTIPVISQPVNDLRSTTKIFPVLDFSSDSRNALQPESLALNGIASSEEKSSTLTISSPHSTVLQLMKRERRALETQKSALESLMQKGALVPLLNGLQHGTSPLKLLSSHFPTVLKNLAITGVSSPVSLPLRSLDLTPELSSSTSPFVTSSKEDNVLCSQIDPCTSVSIRPSLCRTESSQIPPQALIVNQDNHARAEAKRTSVIDSIHPTGVLNPTQSVDTGISARNAKREDMGKKNARNRSYQDLLGSRPRYLRYNLWNSASVFTPTIADWSETAIPLPPTPFSELNNPIARKTISENPSLFRIVTPIKLEVFRSLLSDHPNRVSSIRFAQDYRMDFGLGPTHISRVIPPPTMVLDRHLMTNTRLLLFVPNETLRSRRDVFQSPLDLIYCRECIVCLLMQFPNQTLPIFEW